MGGSVTHLVPLDGTRKENGVSEFVYVLFGDTGEYSDHVDWVVRGYRDKAQADADCEMLNKLAEGIENLPWAERDAAVRERLGGHDAQARVDYTGLIYSVVEIPVV
jgi:hypothetical protein